MNKFTAIGTMVLVCSVALVSISHAAAVAWDNGGGDNQWTTTSNWDGNGTGPDGSPGHGDDVTIGAGYTVNITNDVTEGGTVAFNLLHLGNATTTLNIQSNGVITAGAQFSTWPKGTVNIEGRFNWKHATYDAGGTTTVSGNGLLTNDGAASWITLNWTVLTLQLTGDSATISVGYDLGYFGGTSGLICNLTPGVSGINPVHANANLKLDGTLDELNVDVSNYDYAAYGETLTLFTVTSGSITGTFETETITGAGSDATIVYDTTEIRLENIAPRGTVVTVQ